jgi:hypothetical protein
MDFVFDNEDWEIDFDAMSDKEFHEFVSEEFWTALAESTGVDPVVVEHNG